MSRIKNEILSEQLQLKKKHYCIRVTAYLKGGIKEDFMNDCIFREVNESKHAREIISAYYKLIKSFPELKQGELSELPNMLRLRH